MVFCGTSPVPNTIALGGVATGSINAQEAATAIKLAITTGSTPTLGRKDTNTGTNKAALAVLLASSVKNTTNVTATTMATTAWVLCKNPPIVSPRNKLAPVTCSTWLKHKPPPNKNNTPQSAPSSTSCHSTARPTARAIMAITATKLSKETMPPSMVLMGLLNIQKNTVAPKINKVTFFFSFHSIFSSVTAMAWPNRGFNKKYKSKIADGNSSKVSGKALMVQSKKAILVSAAAMALGGLPTNVAIPPILEL